MPASEADERTSLRPEHRKEGVPIGHPQAASVPVRAVPPPAEHAASGPVPPTVPASAPPGRALVAGALLAATAFLMFYRLGAGSLWDQDEPLYAQMAREMVQTGDWLTLHFNGAPWYVHPPLYVWLAAATGAVAGFSTFTARVWSAAAGVLVVLVTVLIGTRLFGRRTGMIAGAVLAVTLQLLVQGHLTGLDTLLLFWMLLAVHAFIRAHQTGDRAEYLRFFLWCGLATLTKGPVGLLLPGLVIAAFVTIRRAWSRWRGVPWRLGLAIYAAVGGWWYAVETWLHGWPFFQSVFWHFGIERFFGVVDAQTGPWYFYVPVIVLGALPWTTFLPAAAAHHIRRLRTDGSLLVVLWCVVTFLFYTAADTKVPSYILPVYPFAAIAVAAVWDSAQAPPGADRRLGISLAALIALVAALVAGIARYFAGLYPGAQATFSQLAYYGALGRAVVIPAAALGIGLAAAAAFMAARAKVPAFVALCAAMAALWLGMLTWVAPVIEAYRSMRPLALAIRAQWQPGDRIVGYRVSYASLVYYTGHDVIWVSRPTGPRAAVCPPGRVFIAISAGRLAELQAALPAGLIPVADRNGVRVLLKPASVHCVPAGGSGLFRPVVPVR